MNVLYSWFESLISIFNTIQIKDIVDIAIITLLVFSLFQLVRQTRAEQLLKGVLLLLIFYAISSFFQLTMFTSLLRTFFQSAVIIVAIIFQPEIRKALEQLGRNKMAKKYVGFLTTHTKSEKETLAIKKAISDIAEASMAFSKSKTGALIVLERQTMLEDIATTGTILNSDTSVALFGNIFFNKAPLHDGATIIRDGKIYASGCILPLTDNKSVDINLGTRHRAALGMSEQSDAVVLIVSEETGVISLAIDGQLQRDYTKESLTEALEDLILDEEQTKESFRSLFKRKEKKDEE